MTNDLIPSSYPCSLLQKLVYTFCILGLHSVALLNRCYRKQQTRTRGTPSTRAEDGNGRSTEGKAQISERSELRTVTRKWANNLKCLMFSCHSWHNCRRLINPRRHPSHRSTILYATLAHGPIKSGHGSLATDHVKQKSSETTRRIAHQRRRQGLPRDPRAAATRRPQGEGHDTRGRRGEIAH
jgi:hypothetical protein